LGLPQIQQGRFLLTRSNPTEIIRSRFLQGWYETVGAISLYAGRISFNAGQISLYAGQISFNAGSHKN
jgi:hypothetical protein